MEELTLARFILEMSLMDYDLIEERESFMAAAALLLARKMKYPKDVTVWVKFTCY
jgi:cyclin, C-terminal domain